MTLGVSQQAIPKVHMSLPSSNFPQSTTLNTQRNRPRSTTEEAHSQTQEVQVHTLTPMILILEKFTEARRHTKTPEDSFNGLEISQRSFTYEKSIIFILEVRY